MIKAWIVYDGGRLSRLSRVNAMREVLRWRRSSVSFPDHPSRHVIISDDAAQTIASWWASPDQPYTTMLSTQGRVDRYATLDHFGTEAECETASDGAALRALGAYLTARQQAGDVSYRLCACRDCMDITTGRVGELCPWCVDTGCDPTDNSNPCGRDDTNECACDVLAYPPGYRCPHDPER